MKSEQLFARAVEVIPGGVNSPVRSFKNVGTCPRFIKKAAGSKIYDVDDKEYIDYIGSWGPMILGHNHPFILEAVEKTIKDGLSFGAVTEKEVEMAELICSIVPSVEMVRMVNSGTEAVMSALRLARGYTGRNKIIKFAGCYHGHSDAMLVKAGSGLLTEGIPDSLGVPEGVAADTLIADFNDLPSVERLFAENEKGIAAVIVEALPANMGVVLPKEGFLAALQALCRKNGSLLIVDEVITGFRLALAGAQEYFGLEPDLTIFGKIIGGGMPVGAYGGKKEIMSLVSPCGGVYQAGTLSGNPVAMAAGLAQLQYLKEHPSVYDDLARMGGLLAEGLKKLILQYDIAATVNNCASLSCLFFAKSPVDSYQAAKASDTELYALYFRSLLAEGIYIAPAQFEAAFVSVAHTVEDIAKTLAIVERTFSSWA